MNKYLKDNSGVTLIALVITIIILIILAVFSISAVVGDDGIISSTEEASLETEQTQFLEDAKAAYTACYASKRVEDDFSNVTFKEVADLLTTKYGYKDKVVVHGESSRITIPETYITLQKGEVQEVEVKLEEDVNLYMKMRGKYYPVTFDGENFAFGVPTTNLGTVSFEYTIEAESNNTAVAKVEVDYTNNKLKVTGEAEGQTKIVAKYGNSSASFDVTIAQIPVLANYSSYVNVSSYGENYTLKNGWKYLYSDEETIYLMYETYLEEPIIPRVTNIKVSSDGKVSYLDPGKKYTDLDDKTEDLDDDEEKLKEEKVTVDLERRNAFENYLTDSSIWENFSSGIAVALRNRKVSINASDIVTVGALTVEQFEKIKDSDVLTGNYWLAGGVTSEDTDTSQVKCANDGKIESKKYYDLTVGLRPVVAIPKNEQTLNALGISE